MAGVWVSDKNDRLVYLNKAMTEISGLCKDKAIGLDLWKDLPKDTIAHFGPFYKKVKDILVPVRYESINIIGICPYG